MIEFEITNEMLEKAEERMYNMERSAKSVFDELFPNLDFEKDFLDNHCFSDIKYLFETVEKVEDGGDDPNFVALYKLLRWTLEGQMHELIREHNIETIMNFDEREIEEFLTWLQEDGLTYEEAHNAEIQMEMLSCFLNEKKGDE